MLVTTAAARRLSRHPLMVMVRRWRELCPNVPGHDCPWGWDGHVCRPKQPKSWPHLATSCSPGPIKFAQPGCCRESLGTRAQVTGQSCGQVRGHNWLLSASGVTGHPCIPICYPDACSQAQMESSPTSDTSGSEVTSSRPLQSVEVLTTLGSRDPPYNRQPAGGHLCSAPRGLRGIDQAARLL